MKVEHTFIVVVIVVKIIAEGNDGDPLGTIPVMFAQSVGKFKVCRWSSVGRYVEPDLRWATKEFRWSAFSMHTINSTQQYQYHCVQKGYEHIACSCSSSDSGCFRMVIGWIFCNGLWSECATPTFLKTTKYIFTMSIPIYSLIVLNTMNKVWLESFFFSYIFINFCINNQILVEF